MRDIAITLVVAGFLPMILKRPYIGILLFSWLSYMNPHRLSWGFAYDFPFAAIVVGVTIISMLFSKEAKNIPWSAVSVVLLVFVGWMTLTTVFSLYPEDAFGEWKRTIKIQLMVFITMMLIRDLKSLNLLVWVIALSIGFFGIKGGVFAIATGGNFIVFGPPGTFFGDNNALALALVMVLPLMRYLQLTADAKWIKLALGVGMGLMLVSIITSYSRGAFLAVSAILFFLVMKSRRKVVFAAALVVIIPIALTAVPDKWFDRIGTIQTYEEDSSALGRINAWWFAFNLAKDRPLVGGGFQTFDPRLFYKYAPAPEDFHDAHSIYFEVLGEHGFVGLTLFLLLGVLALKNGVWINKNCKDIDSLKWAKDLASMVQVSLIGYATGGAFLGLAYFDLYYHLVAILVILRVLVEKELIQLLKRDGEKQIVPSVKYNNISPIKGTRGSTASESRM